MNRFEKRAVGFGFALAVFVMGWTAVAYSHPGDENAQGCHEAEDRSWHRHVAGTDDEAGPCVLTDGEWIPVVTPRPVAPEEEAANVVWIATVVVYLSNDNVIPKAPQFAPSEAACRAQLDVSREFLKAGVGQNLADTHDVTVESVLFACVTAKQFFDEAHFKTILDDEGLREPMSFHASESSI